MPETIPLDKLAKVYRKIRTRIQELTTEYETQVEGLKTTQQEVSNAIKDHMLQTGLKSVRTDRAPSSCRKRHATPRTTGTRSNLLCLNIRCSIYLRNVLHS